MASLLTQIPKLDEHLAGGFPRKAVTILKGDQAKKLAICIARRNVAAGLSVSWHEEPWKEREHGLSDQHFHPRIQKSYDEMARSVAAGKDLAIVVGIHGLPQEITAYAHRLHVNLLNGDVDRALVIVDPPTIAVIEMIATLILKITGQAYEGLVTNSKRGNDPPLDPLALPYSDYEISPVKRVSFADRLKDGIGV